MTVQNQAVSSTNGQLYTWVTASPDWVASSYPGPGSALHIAVSMAPPTAGGGGGGVTDHGALTGLTDDDHASLYALFRRPIQAYTGASNDFALADTRKFVTASHTSALSLRVRLQSALTWTTADELGGANVGAGTLTITAEAGVTINGTTTVPPNGWFWLKRTTTNVWQCFVGGTGGGGGTYTAGTGLDLTADVFSIAAGGVAATQLASDAVQTAKVANDAVTYPKIQNVSAASRVLGRGSGAGAGDVEELTPTGGLEVSGTSLQRSALTGDVTAAAGSNATTIAANAVTTAKILDGAVTAAKLSSLSITDIAPVVAATTGNVALTGAYAVDGIALSNGDRYLAWKQTTASQNGVYIYNSAGAHARAPDADATADFRPGIPFLIASGTAHGGKLAVLLTSAAITVGSTSIAYGVSFAAPVSGTDDNKVAIASGGALTYALLANANVDAAAAIAGTKIAPDFGAQTIKTTGVYESGSSPATAGDLRVTRGFVMRGRTTTGGGTNVALIQWTTSDELKIGDVGLGGVPLGADIYMLGDNTQIRRTGNVAFEVGTTVSIQQTGGLFEWAGTQTAQTMRVRPSSASAYTSSFAWQHNAQDVSGAGSSGQDFDRRAGDATGPSGTRNGGNLYDRPGTGATSNGNWGWFVQKSDAVNFQSMQGGVYIKNCSVIPAGNPSGGGFFYVESGALKYRGSGGTVTTLGPA